MLNLVQQPWRHGAVEDEVAIEELHFFDSLPSPNGCICRWWRWIVVPSFQIAECLVGVDVVRVRSI